MNRHSEITRFHFGYHHQTDPRYGAQEVAHTDLCFHYRGEDYGCRVQGHFSANGLRQQEQAFMARRAIREIGDER